MQWRHVWLVAVIGVILGASALAIAVVFWDLPPTGIEKRSERAEIVRNLGLVIGGVLALGIAVWRSKAAQDQVNVSDLDRLDRQYLEAVSRLSDPDTVSRLAGIRMLEQLANRKPQVFREDVVRVLCEFARNPTGVGGPDLNATSSLPRFTLENEEQEDVSEHRATNNESRREEIEAAIRVVSDCNNAAEDKGPRIELTLNLTGLALHRAKLDKVNLSGANLEGSRLVSVNFNGADLSGANLSLANLTAAKLTGTKLQDTVLLLATLQRAQFIQANVSNARLSGANVTGAVIYHSNFSGVQLSLPSDADLAADFDVLPADEFTATGWTQQLVDAMWAHPDNPPRVDGIVDEQTGQVVTWRGGKVLPETYRLWPRN